jgi:hypothetical protein
VSMFLALLSFFLFLIWRWVASLNIIDVCHLGLPHPHSYTIIFHMFSVLRFNVFYTSF